MIRNPIIVRQNSLVVLADHKGITYEILFDKDMLPMFREMNRKIYLSFENCGNGKRLVARYEYPTTAGSTRKIVHMSRLVSGASPWEITVHLNGDTLDNRKSNLKNTLR